MGIEPLCFKCSNRHFFNEPCLPKVAHIPREEQLTSPGECSDCQAKQRRINELEAKLEHKRALKRGYQKEYMRKRRAK